MAVGRILKKQISLSEAVNDVSLPAALLFTWAITHADDFGRMLGSPRRIKAQVVPMREEFEVEVVAACLSELDSAGLIRWYTIAGEQYVWFPTWDTHQSGLHKRTASKIPEPPDPDSNPKGDFPEIPGNSGNPPASRAHAELNRTELNGTDKEGEQEPEEPNAPTMKESAREDLGITPELWIAAVDVVSNQAPPSAVEVLRKCRVVPGGDQSLVVTPESEADRERVKRWLLPLQATLRKLTGQSMTLTLLDPQLATRGP